MTIAGMTAGEAVNSGKGAFLDQRGGDRRADSARRTDYHRRLITLLFHGHRLAIDGAGVKAGAAQPGAAPIPPYLQAVLLALPGFEQLYVMVLPVEVLTVTIRPAGVLTTVPGTGAGFGAATGRGFGGALGCVAGLAVGNGDGRVTGRGLGAGATFAGAGFAAGVGLGFGVGAGFAAAVGVGLGAGLAANAGAAINAAASMNTGMDRDMEHPLKTPASAERASMSQAACPIGGSDMTNPSSGRHARALPLRDAPRLVQSRFSAGCAFAGA